MANRKPPMPRSFPSGETLTQIMIENTARSFKLKLCHQPTFVTPKSQRKISWSSAFLTDVFVCYFYCYKATSTFLQQNVKIWSKIFYWFGREKIAGFTNVNDRIFLLKAMFCTTTFNLNQGLQKLKTLYKRTFKASVTEQIKYCD